MELEIEERAAIMEYDGGLERSKAERLARSLVGIEAPQEPQQLNLIEPEYKQHLRNFYRKR